MNGIDILINCSGWGDINKEFDNDEADAEKTREVKLSGKKDKVDTKPQTKLNPSEYGHIDAAG